MIAPNRVAMASMAAAPNATGLAWDDGVPTLVSSTTEPRSSAVVTGLAKFAQLLEGTVREVQVGDHGARRADQDLADGHRGCSARSVSMSEVVGSSAGRRVKFAQKYPYRTLWPEGSLPHR